MRNFNLFLHIGPGKTGTTAIQSFCSLNNEKLNTQGYHYLKSPRWGDNSHHLLGFALWGNQRLGLAGIPEVSIPEIFQKIENELVNLPSHINNIIISSELLFELADTHLVNPLVAFIEKHFSTVQVICYLRRQDEHIQSLYQQWIKTAKESVKGKTIKEFVANYKGDFYYEKLEPWKNLFGIENIKVRIYEKPQFIGGNIFNDFGDAIGIKEIEKFDKPPSNLSNLSINPEATELLRICTDMDYNKLVKIWPNATKQNLTNYSLLTAKEKAEIINTYEESNKKVAKEYLKKADGVLFNNEILQEENLNTGNKEMSFEFLVPTLLSIFQDQHQHLANLEEKIKQLEIKQKEQAFQNSLLQNNLYKQLNLKLIYQLNRFNYEELNCNDDISNVIFKENEYEFNCIGSDPCFYILVALEKGKNYNVKVVLQLSEPANTQLFYLTENEKFNEQNSIILKTGKEFCEHNFNLNIPNIASNLRFDPMNSPGVCRIKSFQIFEIL